MMDNEAIIIEGFEQFSHYAGYADNLKYFGNYNDKSLVSRDFISIGCSN
jgi:hypothetical protein